MNIDNNKNDITIILRKKRRKMKKYIPFLIYFLLFSSIFLAIINYNNIINNKFDYLNDKIEKLQKEIKK